MLLNIYIYISVLVPFRENILINLVLGFAIGALVPNHFVPSCSINYFENIMF